MMHLFKKRILLSELYLLRGKILKPDDRVLFDEALKSLSKGAYRGAYILNWISAAESLRSKIVDLALKDAEAGRALGEIEKLEQQNMSPDKTIIDKAMALGLLEKEEYKKLEHIRDMRNSYAHPTRVAPSLEEVGSAFHQVHSYVLSRPSMLRHGYVANLITSMVQNRHFLDNDSPKIEEYAATISARIHPDALPFLLRRVCEGYDSSSEDVVRVRVRSFARGILLELRPDLSQEQWGVVSLIDQHPLVASLIFAMPEIWDSLPEQGRDMCFGYLVEPVDQQGNVRKPTATRLNRLNRLREAGKLTARQITKMDDVVSNMSLKDLVEAKRTLPEIIDKVITDLKSHNWYIQNPAIRFMRSQGLETIEQLPEALQEELGRNVLQAAEGHSGSAIEFVRNELQDKPLSLPFTTGLLKEVFTNEKLEFRVKDNVLDEILKIVAYQDNSEKVVSAAIKDIEGSRPGWAFTDTTVEKIADKIDLATEAMTEESKKVQIRQLSGCIRAQKSRLERLNEERSGLTHA